MENTNWLKQTPDEPLFSELLWSQPENKRHSGKLLIVGGHQQSFSAASEAYSAALRAGIGNVKVVLPNKLEKMLKSVFPEAEYISSTPIGSFSRQALADLLDLAGWADAVLLAGDFGRNSETSILLDSFISTYSGRIALTGDSIDYFFNQPEKLVSRPKTLLIGELAQLQKLALPHLIQQNADFVIILKQLSDWVNQSQLGVMSVTSNQIIAAYKQHISTSSDKINVTLIDLAVYTTVWWLQQPGKTFESITTAAYHILHEGQV